MVKLKDKSQIPYGGGYKLDLPDLGMVAYGTEFMMLMTNIKKYRLANAFPIGLGLEDEVEQEVCKKYPTECSHCIPEMVPTAVKLTWSDVVQGTMIVARHRLGGLSLVDQGEANRRAAICAKCPWKAKVELPCSYFCGELAELVRVMIGAREITSSNETHKQGCAVCRCYIDAMAWVDLKTQQSVLPESKREMFREVAKTYPCWKAEGI
jgi:hypothetical protein